MTIAEDAEFAPPLAMPPRPARRLSSLQLIKVALRNSVAAFDEAMFDELILERRFLWYRTFAVSDPEGIRRVMLDNADNYPRIPQMRRVLEPALGEGLLSAEGEVWHRHRRLMTPTMDHRSVLNDAPIVTEGALETAAILAALPQGEPTNISHHLGVLLTRTVARIFGDISIEALLTAFLESPRTRRLIDFVQMGSRFDWIYGPNVLRTRGHAFDPQVFRLIAERRREDYQGRRDLLWRLVNARDRTTGESLSDQEVRDEAVTLAFGGVDTTMRGFSWVWYLLAMHPWAEARVHAELDTVLGGRVATADDLPKLVFLRKVIDESLRLYPAIPVMLRVAAADDEVCGHHIPRGSIISVAPWVVHRHRKLWDDPDRFDPERFSPENATSRHRYAYIPFALGPHICIGASLAIMEMLLIAAVLAQRFRFCLAPGYPIEAVGGFLTLRVNGGLQVIVEPRTDGPPAAG